MFRKPTRGEGDEQTTGLFKALALWPVKHSC